MPDTSLKTFARRLANLSGQNKALLHLRLSAQQDADLQAFHFAAGKPAWQVVAQLIGGAKRVALTSQGQGGGTDNELARRLLNIFRRDKALADETGAQDLQVAWPYVRGRWASGGLVRAPLLFFPVRLVQQAGIWYLERREAEPIAFNKTFLVALAFHNQLAIPEALIEEDFEDLLGDALAFRNGLYALLKEAELPIHFNQALYEPEPLHPFAVFKKDEYEALTAPGMLKLEPEGVIGLFPQADSYMGQDFDQLIDEGLSLESLLAKPEGPYFPTPHPAWPLELDASQELVLRRARQGESLSVQGPPGTGKSQLIANLAADAMAAGLTVLVVCQKRAALDVVHARLSAIGLADSLALVHDFRDDRAALYEPLAEKLSTLLSAEPAMASVQQAEAARQNFASISERLAEAEEELNDFVAALFAPTASGLSPKQLYLKLVPGDARVPLQGLHIHFSYPAAYQTERTLARLQACREALVGIELFWASRHSQHGATPGSQAKTAILLRDWDRTSQGVEELAGKAKLNLKAWKRWQRRLAAPGLAQSLTRVEQALQNEAVRAIAAQLTQKRNRKLLKRLPRLLAQARRLLQAQPFGQAGIDEAKVLMVRPDEQGLLKAIGRGLERRRAGLFSWLLFRFFDTNGKPVLRISQGDDTVEQRLLSAERRLKAALSLKRFAVQLQQKLGPATPMPADPGQAQAWKAGLALLEQGLKVASFASRAKLGKPVLQRWFASEESRKAWFAHAHSQGAALLARQQELSKALSDKQIDLLLQVKADPLKAADSLERYADILRECDMITAGLSPEQRSFVGLLLAYKPEAGETRPSLQSLFANSLAYAWAEAVEDLHPVLRLPASPRLGTLQGEILALEQARTQAGRGQVLSALAARQSEWLSQTNPRGLRELLHQLSKKRRIWPIRKLLAAYAQEVLMLKSCWLASPETVSAIMPMQTGLFDLVVFDEASQCFAERGLAAAYRGKQLLITGDNQQLKPFDLYRLRYEGQGDDESPDTDAQSLLDLAALYLPQAGLTGHYRSHAPELIEFSNRHFYKGRLQMLPARETGPAPALEVRHVPGLWDERTNLPEAEAVVAFLKHHLQVEPNISIGVITFNQPQQQLILDLLDDAAAEQGHAWPSLLFVKNIENVQGDERDLIVFSLGYAPDEAGKLRLQFGSLSQVGGENRLNVAITRARERIVLFTALEPGSLALGPGAPAGPKLLAAFIEYAYRVWAGAGAYEPLGLAGPAHATPTEGESLATRLAEADASLRPQLPVADLTRDNAGIPSGLVFTDDASLAQAPLAKAYLVATPARARRLGWQVEQYFSRQLLTGQPLANTQTPMTE